VPAEVTDEDDKQIVDWLEHVNFCCCYFKSFIAIIVVSDLFVFTQALALSKNRAAKMGDAGFMT
jgi:hypothetical protein